MLKPFAITKSIHSRGRPAASHCGAHRLRAAALKAAVSICAGLVISQAAIAQDYPNKSIELVVPYPAGSTTDVVMRLFIEPLSASLGKPLVMNHIPGAGGIIGTERIAKQKPDGYTLGAASSAHPSLPFLLAEFKLDPVKDFTPICMFGRQPIVALINPTFPAQTAKEFIAQVRANPGKYNYAVHSGQVELDFGSMAKLGNLSMVGVQYRGGPQAIAGVLGNEVHIMITGFASAKPLMDSGRMRAIAISSGETFAGLGGVDNLPQMSEEIAGYRGSSAWWGLIGPPGLPDAVVQKVSEACNTALRSESIRSRMRELLILPATGAPNELRDRITGDVENTRKQVAQTGVKPR